MIIEAGMVSREPVYLEMQQTMNRVDEIFTGVR